MRYQDLCKDEPKSANEINELVIKYREADANGNEMDREFYFEEIIKNHARMIYKYANEYSQISDAVKPDMLFADGVIALGKALNTFDTSKNKNFSSYACSAIILEIKYSDQLVDHIGLPHETKYKIKAIAAAESDLLFKRNDTTEFTAQEIYDNLTCNTDKRQRITLNQVKQYKNGHYELNSISLQEEIQDIEDMRYEDVIGCEDKQYDQVDLEIDKEKLFKAISELAPDEQRIMVYSYGLFGFDKLTNKEISERLVVPIKIDTIIKKRNRIVKKLQEKLF